MLMIPLLLVFQTMGKQWGWWWRWWRWCHWSNLAQLEPSVVLVAAVFLRQVFVSVRILLPATAQLQTFLSVSCETLEHLSVVPCKEERKKWEVCIRWITGILCRVEGPLYLSASPDVSHRTETLHYAPSWGRISVQKSGKVFQAPTQCKLRFKLWVQGYHT